MGWARQHYALFHCLVVPGTITPPSIARLEALQTQLVFKF